MYVLIDNYDSFTYNVYQYCKEITDKEIRVIRNDKITIEKLKTMKIDGLIISPGPGRPEDAGISVDAIREFQGKVPILGVCLGLQAVAYAFGGEIVQAKHILHGKEDTVTMDGKGLFRTLPKKVSVVRYHSLVAQEQSLPDCLEISAVSSDGEIMGLRHKEYVIESVQFHPESIASDYGKRIIENFFSYKREAFSQSSCLKGLLARNDLSVPQAEDFMDEVTSGRLGQAAMAGILIALNAKGFTSEEVTGCAAVLRRKALKMDLGRGVLDTCGTGGDGKGTFNISSLTALTASALGATVAKHGNRAVSSISGSAEFYRELGIPVSMTKEGVESLIRETGFGFLFAPMYHGAMRFAAPVRKDLGVKTIFNVLGPLVNPASADYQVIGVYDKSLLELEARAAQALGVKRVLTVHSRDGLDEISIADKTDAYFIDETGNDGPLEIDPENFGIRGFSTEDMAGGTAEENAAEAMRIMEGDGSEGLLHAVSLNTGAALFTAGITFSIKEGYNQAKAAFMEGKVLKQYKDIIQAAKGLGGNAA
ncbi:MAG: bifunctional anthranilate synthase component II/anthranilate phosphoribosyltransferase [Spirochaetia bacterium]